ncbi:MAG: class I SAM-dependent methyltransferase [Candidatus Omnitrophica bacterium]|nr:class I SAM-dependent methyltransferase [Candidatus Omnitrophota bacterium]
MRANIYDQLAKIDESHWWVLYRRKLTAGFLKRLGVDDVKGTRALDMGCGTGGNTAFLKMFAPDVTGVDISENALGYAKVNYPGCNFVRGDIRRVSEMFREGTFKLVTIFNVLYHEWVPDEAEAIREAYRVLSPGGFLVMTEPAFNFLYRAHDRETMTKKRYRLGEFTGILERTGFKVKVWTYFGIFNFFPALVLSLLDRVRGAVTGHGGNNRKIAELGLPGKRTNSFLLALMMAEGSAIQAGLKVPFGVTILCIAQKPAGEARKV